MTLADHKLDTLGGAGPGEKEADLSLMNKAIVLSVIEIICRSTISRH